MLKNKSGITLIALIVTIIVLIILAGISINLLIGDNGIITRAKDVAIEQAVGQRKEAVNLAITTEYAKQEGDQSKMTVEGVLKELQTTQNSNKIYAMKGTTLITATEGNTSLAGATFYFPEEINGSANTGIVVAVDSNLGVAAESSQEVEDASQIAANIEVSKANITTNVTWSNGVPSIEYSETSGANVTLVYTIGESTTETTLANTTGTITGANITLGTTVNIFAKANGKYSDAVSVTVQDTTAPSGVTITATTQAGQNTIAVTVTSVTEAQSGIKSYTYNIKGATEVNWTTVTKVVGTDANPNTYTFTVLGNDIYTVKATVTDNANNTSAESNEVTKDKKAPTITNFVVEVTPTENSITVSVTATDDDTNFGTSGTYTYCIDGVADGQATTSNTHTYANLTAGTYTLSVVVADTFGNQATSEEREATIEEEQNNNSQSSENDDFDLYIASDGSAPAMFTYEIINTQTGDVNDAKALGQIADKDGNIQIATATNNVRITGLNKNVLYNYLMKLRISKSDSDSGSDSNESPYSDENEIDSLGEFSYWLGETPSVIKNMVIPSSVKLDGNMNYSATGTTYQVTEITNFDDFITAYRLGDQWYACFIESLYLPDTITKVVKASETQFNSNANDDDVPIIRVKNIRLSPNMTEIPCFSESPLETITIPNGVTVIPKEAFNGCENLTSVSMPDSITRIERMAFYGTGLTSITLSANIEYIGNSAFRSSYSYSTISEITFKSITKFRVTLPDSNNWGPFEITTSNDATVNAEYFTSHNYGYGYNVQSGSVCVFEKIDD